MKISRSKKLGLGGCLLVAILVISVSGFSYNNSRHDGAYIVENPLSWDEASIIFNNLDLWSEFKNFGFPGVRNKLKKYGYFSSSEEENYEFNLYLSNFMASLTPLRVVGMLGITEEDHYFFVGFSVKDVIEEKVTSRTILFTHNNLKQQLLL